MQILMVSDLHYSLPQLDWLLKVGPRYDLVIIAGDLLDTNSIVGVSAQMVVILKYLDRLRREVPLLVCSGNHDLDIDLADEDGERVSRWVQEARAEGLWVDGDTVDIGGERFTICPWWDGETTRAAIDKQIAEVAAGRADAPSGWKWVYHAPPSSLPVSWSGQRHFGDPSLADWIERYKPDFVFCGHVHEAPFSRGGSWVARQGETLVFNPGKQIGGFPTHIVLDTERREAVWFSLEGAERLDWSVPATAKPEPLYEMPGWMPA